CLVNLRKEGFVLLDCTAYRATELVQVELFFGASEETAALQLCVAKELKNRPVEAVAAGFRRHQHSGTRASTVFGRVVIGEDFEFLDGIDRRYDRNAACGEFVIVVSVEQPIRALRA